jgi:hypothetical protein
MLANRVRKLVERIEYRDEYVLVVKEDEGRGGAVYMQVHCWRPDTFTGQMDWGRGGKAYLSPWATDSELVQTAFGLLKAYEEHECREAFRFDGVRVFGPHIDVMALVEIAGRLDARPRLVPVDG